MALTQIPSAMVAQDGGMSREHMGPDAAIPAGVVLPYAGAVAPSGWLMCAGQAVSRTTYAALFSAIGTTFGAGDGSTTFTLPDGRGRVIAGKDDMGGSAANRLTSGGSGVAGTTLGGTGGVETHTLTSAQIPAHNHPIGDSAGATGSASGGGKFFSGTGSATTTSNSTGGGGAHNNTQPTIIMNHIIKT